jgi:Cu-Zn family superoxide dismutase
VGTALARALLAAAALAAAGCQTIPADAPRASADLQPTKGNKASGTVHFYQIGDRVRVIAKVAGLVPGREHGFHIHEVGDCGSGDGMSTKGHFNPLKKPHAHFSTPERHAGDMPALKGDAGGMGALEVDLDIITVTPGPTSIVGRGLIVHADPDDYKTQPTGNAGARIACAVIRRG